MKTEILPSLLAADFGRLSDEILRAEASGAEALHLDIMDAHFVPNLSFGPDVVALASRVAPNFYRNVHLMMTRPDLYLEAFANAGAQTIQIHVEVDCDIHNELKRIRSMGLKNAIAMILFIQVSLNHGTQHAFTLNSIPVDQFIISFQRQSRANCRDRLIITLG